VMVAAAGATEPPGEELAEEEPAPAGADAVPPSVSACVGGSTYAVAVIVPLSSSVAFAEVAVVLSLAGWSLTPWIVSRRPLTCSPPEEVRNVKWLSAPKRL
jgi:hypothetical protein